MKRFAVVVVVGVLAACKPALTPETLQQYQSRTLYTCCNFYHESDAINDANYHVGTIVPLGSPVQVQAAGRNSITFTAAGTKLTLSHDYGKDQEPFQQYVDKVLVPGDPRSKLASFPRSAQDAIRDGRVEKGMTREQVILSLGYPATHRTPSTAAPEWTYWYNRWVTYKVAFDDTGKVANVIGRPAPTEDRPITPNAPPPRPTSKPKKRK